MEIQPNELLCFVVPAGIAALGIISYARNTIHRSPPVQAVKQLYDASQLANDQVGLRLKKNVYDRVPETEAAYHAVNPVTNVLTLGFQKHRAHSAFNRAKETAEIVRSQEASGVVGTMKGCRTLVQLGLLGGGVTGIVFIANTLMSGK